MQYAYLSLKKRTSAGSNGTDVSYLFCFLQVHIGGHIVEFDPTSGRVKVSVDGSAYDIADGEEKDHMEGDETIFRYKDFFKEKGIDVLPIAQEFGLIA
jgi:hypothetical protein